MFERESTVADCIFHVGSNNNIACPLCFSYNVMLTLFLRVWVDL